ncbi:ketopantoate reductase family protein [Spirochaetota bacterium]
MKTAIVGPGAIGLLYYYLLSRKESNICMLDKTRKRAGELKKRGFIIEIDKEKHTIPINICTEAKEIGIADLILICVKSYDSKKAARSIREIANKNTIVLSLQNGLGNIEIMQKELPQCRVISAVTNLGSTLLATGHIRYAGKGPTYIGGDVQRSKLTGIAKLFSSCSIEATVTDNIESALWSKLIINAGINALTAILRITNGDILTSPSASILMEQAVTEAHKIAKAKNIPILYDDPLAKVRDVCTRTAHNRSSMLQDVERRKKTEIDAINKAVYTHGRKMKLSAPVNEMLAGIVKAVEEAYGRSVR